MITEIRIGNWFKRDAQPNGFQIDKHSFKIFHIYQYDPIPLTEEWLVKLGFKWIEESQGYFDKNHAVYLWVIGVIEFHPFCTNDEDCQIEIKHVHQLQNLCFALTQNELEITNLSTSTRDDSHNS